MTTMSVKLDKLAKKKALSDLDKKGGVELESTESHEYDSPASVRRFEEKKAKSGDVAVEFGDVDLQPNNLDVDAKKMVLKKIVSAIKGQ